MNEREIEQAHFLTKYFSTINGKKYSMDEGEDSPDLILTSETDRIYIEITELMLLIDKEGKKFSTIGQGTGTTSLMNLIIKKIEIKHRPKYKYIISVSGAPKIDRKASREIYNSLYDFIVKCDSIDADKFTTFDKIVYGDPPREYVKIEIKNDEQNGIELGSPLTYGWTENEMLIGSANEIVDIYNKKLYKCRHVGKLNHIVIFVRKFIPLIEIIGEKTLRVKLIYLDKLILVDNISVYTIVNKDIKVFKLGADDCLRKALPSFCC